ncbi:MAG: hypothetical protein AVDCRST_MAG71-2612, partial [uncultured Lysobacter sp.]
AQPLLPPASRWRPCPRHGPGTVVHRPGCRSIRRTTAARAARGHSVRALAREAGRPGRCRSRAWRDRPCRGRTGPSGRSDDQPRRHHVDPRHRAQAAPAPAGGHALGTARRYSGL